MKLRLPHDVLGHFRRHIHATAGQVVAQPLRILRLEADVDQPILGLAP